MKYCPDCGEGLTDNETYCRHCGTHLDEYRNTNTGRNRQHRDHPPIHQPSKTERNQSTLIEARAIGVLAGLAAMAGALAPWAEVELLSVGNQTVGTELSGMDFRIGLVVTAAAFLGVFFFLPDSRASQGLAGFFMLVAALGTAAFINNPLQFQPEVSDLERAVLNEVTQIGIGAYTTLICTMIALIAAMLGAAVNPEAHKDGVRK